MKFGRNYMSKVDWRLQDSILAKKLGCSPTTVWRWRKSLNQPKPLMYRAHPSLSLRDQRLKWDWSLRDADLARKHKLSRERVRQIRKGLGK